MSDGGVSKVRNAQLFDAQLAQLSKRADWQTAIREVQGAFVKMALLVDMLEDRVEALEEELDYNASQGASS